jgi:hypothetical protein
MLQPASGDHLLADRHFSRITPAPYCRMRCGSGGACLVWLWVGLEDVADLPWWAVTRIEGVAAVNE